MAGTAGADAIGGGEQCSEERGVELRVSGSTGPVNVIGARDELAQVVQNLIDNAIKYSEKGDIVDVEIRAGVGASEASAIAGRRWSSHSGRPVRKSRLTVADMCFPLCAGVNALLPCGFPPMLVMFDRMQGG